MGIQLLRLNLSVIVGGGTEMGAGKRQPRVRNEDNLLSLGHVLAFGNAVWNYAHLVGWPCLSEWTPLLEAVRSFFTITVYVQTLGIPYCFRDLKDDSFTTVTDLSGDMKLEIQNIQ